MRTALAVRRLHRMAVAATPDMPGLNPRPSAAGASTLRSSTAPRGRPPRGEVDPVEAMAMAKINQARTLDEALSYLGPEERAITLASPDPG
ncbi:MAG: hypothetical protein WDM84_06730 [Bauldia sp.]